MLEYDKFKYGLFRQDRKLFKRQNQVFKFNWLLFIVFKSMNDYLSILLVILYFFYERYLIWINDYLLLFNKLVTLLTVTKIITCTFQFNKNSIINNK